MIKLDTLFVKLINPLYCFGNHFVIYIKLSGD